MDKSSNTKKPWYKRVWVWIGIIFVLGVIGAAASSDGNTPTTDTKTNTTTEPATQKEESKPATWDVEVAYSKIADGMTKAQVEAAIGKKSDDCSETSAEYVGKIETCNYGGVGDNGMIMVQYQNDKVITKSKNKF